MARRAADNLTLDLFEVPVPTVPLPGALNFNLQLRHLLSEALKACPLSRIEVAARMSELTGDTITKHQLDAWTAESREGWRFASLHGRPLGGPLRAGRHHRLASSRGRQLAGERDLRELQHLARQAIARTGHVPGQGHRRRSPATSAASMSFPHA